jgi:hypothetical protein
MKSSDQSSARPGVDRPIQRTDLEDRLRSLRTDVETVKTSAAGAGIAAGIGVALLLVLMAFILGRARGQKKYAFVEIRRA